MQGMDVSAVLYSRGPKTAVYSPHHVLQRQQSIGMASAAGGGGGQGFSGGYGLFSPGGVMSPFSWDTSTSFRFDFDDLRARSNLLSLSSSIRDADEAAIIQRTSEAEELEGAGPPSVVGRSCRNDDDDGDKEGDEGKRKRGEGQRQKRKGGTFPGGGGGGGGPDFEMKRFKLGVLRNLLANFSLEKTIEKYRNLSSKPFTVRPGDYSFDCAVSAHQLKDKLLRLTGSDRIKINDRHFMQKMQKILEHEDQEKTKKGDEERADGEYQRLRKLMQHGVISAKELQDDECLIAAQASSAAATSAAAAAAAVKGRRRRIKNERNRRTAETHSKQSNPRSKLLRSSLRGSNSQSTINNSMTAINRRPEDQSRNTCCHLPAITCSQSQSTMNNAASSFSSFASPSPRRAASHVYQSQHGDFQSGSILSGCQDRPRRQKEMDDERKEKKTEPVRHCKRDFSKHGGDCTEREGRSSSSLPEVYILPAGAGAAAAAAAGAGSLKRDEHPLIQQMRQEKSVKGLYELAAKISKISF